MEHKPIIFLDGDDTIWKTQEIYDEAKERFASVMNRCGINNTDIIVLLDELDKNRVALRGFSINRFLESMLILYVRLSTTQGLAWDPKIEREIWNIEELLLRPPKLYDDSLQALELLHGKTCLYLLSAGDPAIQKQKVAFLGIENYFTDVYIVSSKTEEVFRRILDSLKQSPNLAWMVGNSMRSDVLPARKAGLHAVLVNRGTWIYDTPDVIDGNKRYYQVNTLIEATNSILNYYNEV